MWAYRLFFGALMLRAFCGSWQIPSTHTCKITIVALLMSNCKSPKTDIKSMILYQRVGLQLQDQERFLEAIL
jgi:hypothetical protein